MVGECKLPQLREAQAKRVAALNAYEQLYKLGEVDEHLLPACGANVPTSQKSNDAGDGALSAAVGMSQLEIDGEDEVNG